MGHLVFQTGNSVQTFTHATKAKLKQALLDRQGSHIDGETHGDKNDVTSLLMKMQDAPGIHVHEKDEKILIIHSDEVLALAIRAHFLPL